MLDAAYRKLYVLAMLSGLRAGTNRIRGWRSHQPLRTAALHRTKITSRELGELQLSVHGQPQPRAAVSAARFGLISLRQARPRVGGLLYRYLCLTSHLGCGHVDIAFFEEDEVVWIYGIRNMAQANARRLGLVRTANRLPLAKRNEAKAVLVALIAALAELGLRGVVADPGDCVSLTTNTRLLRPDSLRATLQTLERRYEKLQGVGGPPTSSARRSPAAAGSPRP